MNNPNNYNPMGPAPNYDQMQQMQYQQNIKENDKGTRTSLIVVIVITVIIIFCCCCCCGGSYKYVQDNPEIIQEFDH